MYDVFISYSRKDISFVRELVSVLETNDITYWIDFDGIYSGDKFAAVIHDNIQNSDAVIFVSSANSNSSDWTSGEVALAYKFHKRIIPVLIDRTPFEKHIALYLAALDYIDATADKDEAFAKLVNAIKLHSSKDNMKKTDTVPHKKSVFLMGVLVAVVIVICGYLFIRFLPKHIESINIETANINNVNINNTDSIFVETQTIDTSVIPDTPKESSSVSEIPARQIIKNYTVSNSKCICNVGDMTFVLQHIEGGTFLLGATDRQNEYARQDEKPVRKVTISPFYMSETEVTVALWNLVMDGDDFDSTIPVTDISYEQCDVFLERLSEKVGLTFSLPTEAQWEYAAEGGKDCLPYLFSGDDNLSSIGWYAGNTSSLQPVASRQPNGLGLYDMNGNAAEWCSDWYGSYSAATMSDPEGPYSGTKRVIRGGSYLSSETQCRNTARDKAEPDSRTESVGLRIVCNNLSQ